MKKIFTIALLSAFHFLFSQEEKEIAPPFNIKTVSFVQNNANIVPVLELGSGFQLQFDDLYGNNADYFYEIVHCDYNWIPSEIPKNEYLAGIDSQRIQDITTSFNTLQIYSHFTLSIPNQYTTQLKISGNYILKILNESREMVFSRKFVLYEDLATIPVQVKRARTIDNLNFKHNLDFSITSNVITFQNPLKNVKVALYQNNDFNKAIKNIAPQYTMGNSLIYKYDSETQFWAGNEFLYFENKSIRFPANYIAKVDSSTDIYSSHLYPNNARANTPYTLYQDVNGNFVVLNANAEDSTIEADYSWIYFTLSAPSFYLKKDVYITGMFNNYVLGEESKMDFNTKKGVYEKAILIKQGFTNYKYVVADSNHVIDYENSIDGNFYQTENEYTILAYYRDNTARYERVIGRGTASSTNIVN
ncbi:type IX secretion system plug protein [Flavobacterium algicola]|uniref:type IX secretion system plug protein n=1 Tax=Flavobacterium algicola TaxID=556529 RepID=UPI001EFC6136|nr:DUF5103 domain-containing protein [Flavobacterium algicola]MCG9791422.1 DUF5103 domain-containing protein [Flavobacterium algicola]